MNDSLPALSQRMVSLSLSLSNKVQCLSCQPRLEQDTSNQSIVARATRMTAAPDGKPLRDDGRSGPDDVVSDPGGHGACASRVRRLPRYIGFRTAESAWNRIYTIQNSTAASVSFSEYICKRALIEPRPHALGMKRPNTSHDSDRSQSHMPLLYCSQWANQTTSRVSP